ncbi:MAG TPA: hypothetical protein VEZ72_23215, partial [Paenibacillus sp.]|nr:hypothetical protein [Paenibacillus sp.]
MNANKVSTDMMELVRRQDEAARGVLEACRNERRLGFRTRNQRVGIDRLAALLPPYCHPGSAHYRNPEALLAMEEIADAFLATQLESGCITLVGCNIDSPPDTAFTAHLAANLALLARRDAGAEAFRVTNALLTFLERAQPCLLGGGIHTPNHRWVMASALAKLEELFGGDAFRVRAFEWLREGLDITEYGEWTERSNAIYNPICAYHLYDVGRIFGYAPAFEAASRTLSMMRYLLHPGDTVATEYSGRQDFGQTAPLDDRYYVAYHLLASHTGDPALAAMARLTERASTKGPLALLHWMLEPERMTLPAAEADAAPPDDYTMLFGGDRTV